MYLFCPATINLPAICKNKVVVVVVVRENRNLVLVLENEKQ